ncbi:MAG: endonuclease, partial [Bacteroidales bacterium]|nr:endonuclease [Bacteroidales bacterium]
GEELREVMAHMVRNATDSLCLASDGNAKVLIIGDFNCTPSDPLMSELIDPESPVNCSLINLSDGKVAGAGGTYRYQGTWEMIDQIIVSGGLLDSNKGLDTGKEHFRIFSPDFLLKNDNKYPGMIPFSTYRGYSYQGGFSDHLPILLDLVVR